MKTMVPPEITPKSSFYDLTMFLVSSFQETEREMVEDILENREKGLKEELNKSKEILERMLKEEVCFAALVKVKVESLIQSRLEFEKRMKEKCHVLEQEVESLKEGSGLMLPLGSVEKRVVEDEKDLNKKKGISALDLEEELKKTKMLNEEARKEMEKVRYSYEKELKQERDFAVVVKREVENLMHSRVEFEEKMKEKCVVLEKESELKRKALEEEVESMRAKCEALKKETGLMENMLSMAYEEKRVMEDQMRTQREMLENQNDVLHKGFREQLEKMRKSHDEELERRHASMENKLFMGVLEKLEMEELKKSRIQNEEAKKELEGELEKTRESYEKELKQERDRAALMKKEVDNLMHSRVDFEEKMKEKYDVLKQEGVLKRKVLEEEVESLRELCEESKKQSGLMENMLSLAFDEQRVMEHEMRTQREMLENQNDVLRKGFKEELEKMRVCQLELEKELKKSRMQNEGARKEFVGELEKARESYEKKLKQEKDLWENKLSLATTENKKFVIELRKEFESIIESLEGDNRCLQKKNVVCNENLKMMEDLLTKREKDLKDEVEEKETYKKGLKEEQDLFEKNLLLAAMDKSEREKELRKEFEEKFEVLEAENQEFKMKIKTLGNAFVVVEEQLAKLKGVMIHLVV